jgi:hypothetical protein
LEANYGRARVETETREGRRGKFFAIMPERRLSRLFGEKACNCVSHYQLIVFLLASPSEKKSFFSSLNQINEAKTKRKLQMRRAKTRTAPRSLLIVFIVDGESSNRKKFSFSSFSSRFSVWLLNI